MSVSHSSGQTELPLGRSVDSTVRSLHHLDLPCEANIGNLFRWHFNLQAAVVLLPFEFALVPQQFHLADLAWSLLAGESQCAHHGCLLRQKSIATSPLWRSTGANVLPRQHPNSRSRVQRRQKCTEWSCWSEERPV